MTVINSEIRAIEQARPLRNRTWWVAYGQIGVDGYPYAARYVETNGGRWLVFDRYTGDPVALQGRFRTDANGYLYERSLVDILDGVEDYLASGGT